MKNKRIISGILALAIAFTIIFSNNLIVKASNFEGPEPYKVVASNTTACTIDTADAEFLSNFFVDNRTDFTKEFIVDDSSELSFDWASSPNSPKQNLAVIILHPYKFTRNADGSLSATEKDWKHGYAGMFGRLNEKREPDINCDGFGCFFDDHLMSYVWNVFDPNFPYDMAKYKESYNLLEGFNQKTCAYDLYAIEIIFYENGNYNFTKSLYIPTGSVLLDKATIEKIDQTIVLNKNNISYKTSKLKKAKQTFSIKATCEGKVTYSVTKGAKYVSVLKNGKVTVKKGTPKGTYKITVKASATDKCNAAKKTFTITVK